MCNPPTPEMAEDELEDIRQRINEVVSTRNKRKRSGPAEDPLFVEERVNRLKDRMQKALVRDKGCLSNGELAICRFKILPEVLVELENRNTQEILLDQNILEDIKSWLEPLERGIWPPAEIRDTLLLKVASLPIEIEHLRRSQLGHIVAFYAKTKSEYFSETRRLAKRLVQRWQRLLLE